MFFEPRHVPRTLTVIAYVLGPLISLSYLSRVHQKGELKSASGVLLGSLGKWKYTVKNLRSVDTWREITTSAGKVFFFSAYYDEEQKDNPMVRIIGVAPFGNAIQQKVQCIVQNRSLVMTISPTVRAFREHWGMPYAAYRFDCPMTQSFRPLRAGLMAKSKYKDGRFFSFSAKTPESVAVQYSHQDGHQGEFALCVKPLHNAYNRAVWLVEFVEFYKIMGVQHFLFYNHTIGPHVERVLQHYQKSNMLTVLPWALPVRSQKEIRTEGIFAALNDCIFRTRHRFTYTVVVDLDEFIVPRRHDNYYSMMKDLDKAPHLHGAFIFRNTFFYLYWPNDTRAIGFFQDKHVTATPYLLTLFKTQRVKSLHMFGIRSKYIVRPDLVIEAGSHSIWDFVKGKQKLNVHQTTAILHHYRICEFGGFDCMKSKSSLDRTVHKFADRLVHDVMNICMEIFPEAPSCPEAPPLGSPW